MRRWTIVGLVVFAAALAASLTDGFGIVDESWFLQVVARVRGGDVLYGDVFFGATPLSVYATLAVAAILGTEIVAVKIVTNGAFALAVALAARLVAARGGSPRVVWLIVAAALYWGRPYGNPPYTATAMAFYLATLSATWAAVAEPGRAARARWWLLAGALAGLSAMCKQNVGLLAFGATGLAVWSALGWRAAARALAPATAGFVIATLAALLPVAATGGLAGLWEYGFAAKGAYLSRGSVSYLASLRTWLDGLASARSLGDAGRGLHGLVLILPLVTGVVAVRRAAPVSAADRVLLVFAAAAVLTAFPRWDRFHMVYAVPVLLLALAALLRPRASRLDGRRPWIAAAGWAAGLTLLAAAVGRPLVALADRSREPSRAAHFRGPLVDVARAQARADAARALAIAGGDAPLLVLRMDAGYWYLRSGLANPTPFDYPAATSVGRTGERWLIGQVVSGTLPAVCLDNGPPGPMALTALDAVVRETFEPGPDVGPCTVYRVSARARAAGP